MKMNKATLNFILIFVGLIMGLTISYIYTNRVSLNLRQKSNKTLSQEVKLNIDVCDPKKGPFSTEITNPFMPFPVGKPITLEDRSNKVEISAVDETEVINGVITRVVEERDWVDGVLVEYARNYLAQAPDMTVCYFGEDVDNYENEKLVDHDGSWRAGVNGNKAGIVMPGDPKVGQSYQQEVAPGVAIDSARHLSMDSTFTTPIGTFKNVLVVEEVPSSSKRYAKGIGLIYDDGLVLTKR